MKERLGHYKVIGELGAGAMGTVYEGLDEKLDLKVAIKVLSKDIVSDPQNLIRFEKEARAAALLKHPNIAHVFFVGRTDDNLPFYVMEYIDGYTLAEVIRQRMRMTGRQIITIIKQTCNALQIAAEKGILHRDVKPGNIMIEKRTGAKLVDFGIAKVTEGDIELTTTGMALGTPKYMSPEQANGDKIDFRADMYSLGVTMFELLTGFPPFKSDTPVGLLMKHVKEPVPDIYSFNQQFPRGLCRLIERMMAKSPHERYRSYEEIIADLNTAMVNQNGFLSAEWTYCPQDGVNTMLEDGVRCSLCKTTIEPPEREEIYMSVKLTGFDGEEGRARIVQYMKSSTNRSEEVIRGMLKHLPLTLSPRLVYDRAKSLQRKFYSFGGEIELTKVGVKKVKTGGVRPLLQLNTSNPYSMGEKEAQPIVIVKKVRWPIWAAAVAVLFFVVLLKMGIVKVTPEFNFTGNAEVREAGIGGRGAVAGIPGALDKERKAKDSVDSVYNGIEHISSAGNCRFLSRELKDDKLLKALGVVCEQNLFRILMATGQDSVEQLLFKVDGEVDSTIMAPTFGLNLPAKPGEIILLGKRLQPERPIVQGMVVALVAREILRKMAGGKRLPPWLENGVALSLMDRIVPDIYKPERILKGSSRFMDGEEWDQAFEEHNAKAYAQAVSFVNYLIHTYKFDSILRVAKLIEQGTDADTAISIVYYKNASELLQAWFVGKK